MNERAPVLVTPGAVQKAVDAAMCRAGIGKRASCHTLRHARGRCEARRTAAGEVKMMLDFPNPLIIVVIAYP